MNHVQLLNWNDVSILYFYTNKNKIHFESIVVALNFIFKNNILLGKMQILTSLVHKKKKETMKISRKYNSIMIIFWSGKLFQI